MTRDACYSPVKPLYIDIYHILIIHQSIRHITDNPIVICDFPTHVQSQYGIMAARAAVHMCSLSTVLRLHALQYTCAVSVRHYSRTHCIVGYFIASILYTFCLYIDYCYHMFISM